MAMFNSPKTPEEAKKYRYNVWGGNPKGNPFHEGDCAYEYELLENWLTRQCSRKACAGPNNLYCKQHAKAVKP